MKSSRPECIVESCFGKFTLDRLGYSLRHLNKPIDIRVPQKWWRNCIPGLKISSEVLPVRLKCPFPAYSITEAWLLLDHLTSEVARYGMHFVSKCKGPLQDRSEPVPTVYLGNEILGVAWSFVYLARYLTENGGVGEQISTRSSKDKLTCSSPNWVFCRYNVSLSSECQIFNITVNPHGYIVAKHDSQGFRTSVADLRSVSRAFGRRASAILICVAKYLALQSLWCKTQK